MSPGIERQFLTGEITLGEAVDALLVACRMPALHEAVILHGGLEGAMPAAPRAKAGRKIIAADAEIVEAVLRHHRAGLPLVDPDLYDVSAFAEAGRELGLKGSTAKRTFYRVRVREGWGSRPPARGKHEN